jgi:hypothetical protein
LESSKAINSKYHTKPPSPLSGSNPMSLIIRTALLISILGQIGLSQIKECDIRWTLAGASQYYFFSISGGKSYTINRDPGTAVSFSVWPTSAVTGTRHYFLVDWTNGITIDSGPTTQGYWYFDNKVGSAATEVWLYVNDLTSVTKILINNIVPPKPDLTVTSITFDGSTQLGDYQTGQTVSISCRVDNNGSGTASPSSLGIYLGTSTTDYSNRIASKSVSQLSGLTGTYVSHNYTFKDADVGSTKFLLFWADYSGSVAEENENNNKAYRGPFAISMAPPQPPVVAAASGIGQTSFTANWNSSSGATGYTLDVATDNGFTAIVSGWNNLDVGNVTSRVVTGLLPGTPYYYRVRAYNTGGTSSNSGTGTATTNPLTGTLSVTTTPVVGQIYVDGAPKGSGSWAGGMAVGTYFVSFGQVSGYRVADGQWVTIAPNATSSVIGMYAPFGTTVITHGLHIPTDPNPIQEWMIPLAQAIKSRASAGRIFQYNSTTGTFDPLAGNDSGGEVILVYDWVSASEQDYEGFSEGAADALFAGLMGGASSGAFSLDHLHFIGHSRGTVVNSEVAERLLAYGKPVEQVTNLDAHDWGGVFGVYNDFYVNPFSISMPSNHVPNSGVVSWQNISKSESYWQDTDALNNLQGRPVYGSDTNYLGKIGHGEVIQWYKGTIDQTSGLEGWYGTGSHSRLLGGFYFSRLGMGHRTTAEWGTRHATSYSPYPDLVYNRDFSMQGAPFATGNLIPGWDFHGGGGTALIESGVMKFFAARLWRQHNWVYIPEGAGYLSYDVRVKNASGGVSPDIERFQVLIGNTNGVFELADVFDLTQATASFVGRQVSLTPSQHGVKSLLFLIEPRGTATWADAEVWLDNIQVTEGPMPVQLTSFTATIGTDARILFEWRTASEMNNYGFFIQKLGSDGKTYRDIPGSFVPGHGTTVEAHQYNFILAANDEGGRYRLRQVDLDGSTHYSEPIVVGGVISVVEQAPVAFQLLQNYPNPFNPTTMLKFSVLTTGPASMKVYDIVGREIATVFEGTAEAGRYYAVPFDASSLASGVYFYRLVTQQKTDVRRMMLVK